MLPVIALFFTCQISDFVLRNKRYVWMGLKKSSNLVLYILKPGHDVYHQLTAYPKEEPIPYYLNSKEDAMVVLALRFKMITDRVNQDCNNNEKYQQPGKPCTIYIFSGVNSVQLCDIPKDHPGLIKPDFVHL